MVLSGVSKWGATSSDVRDDSGLFGQYNACWYPGSLSRQGIRRNDINSIG